MRMLTPLRPVLVRWLRRDPDEIARRAARFAIAAPDRRAMVARLGRSFLDGYNAVLERGDLEGAADRGRRTEPHYRPFYFEGCAMGYLARGTVAGDCPVAEAERRLLAVDPGYRYLYYVGLGFWYGFRHRARPERLAELVPHVDPLYLPLCYDGFGFKLGFFHGPDERSVWRTLEGAAEEHAPWLFQGFGRALFFVYMDDPASFDAVRQRVGARRARDLEFGRALALGFTGIDRASTMIDHVREAEGTDRQAPRLLGVAWALAARQSCDPRYFENCLAPADDGEQKLLGELPRICERTRSRARSYREWQAEAATALDSAWGRWKAAAAE